MSNFHAIPRQIKSLCFFPKLNDEICFLDYIQNFRRLLKILKPHIFFSYRYQFDAEVFHLVDIQIIDFQIPVCQNAWGRTILNIRNDGLNRDQFIARYDLTAINPGMINAGPQAESMTVCQVRPAF